MSILKDNGGFCTLSLAPRRHLRESVSREMRASFCHSIVISTELRGAAKILTCRCSLAISFFLAVNATVLFADLRGYTSLSQSVPADAISGLLDAFYDRCADAIWEHDGLLNKTLGDAVMAVFNFPIKSADHAIRAVRAAREIQSRWRVEREGLVERLGLAGRDLGVGIGINTGELSFGEFGRSHRDLTAIGNVVNTASRAQSAAGADQILVTREVYQRAQPELAGSEATSYELKGFKAPVELYAA